MQNLVVSVNGCQSCTASVLITYNKMLVVLQKISPPKCQYIVLDVLQL